MKSYLDFDIAFERVAQGYRAHVISSPAGEASVDFSLPFTDLEVEELLAARRPPGARGARSGIAGERVCPLVRRSPFRCCLCRGRAGRAAQQPGRGRAAGSRPASAPAPGRDPRAGRPALGIPVQPHAQSLLCAQRRHPAGALPGPARAHPPAGRPDAPPRAGDDRQPDRLRAPGRGAGVGQPAGRAGGTGERGA